MNNISLKRLWKRLSQSLSNMFVFVYQKNWKWFHDSIFLLNTSFCKMNQNSVRVQMIQISDYIFIESHSIFNKFIRFSSQIFIFNLFDKKFIVFIAAVRVQNLFNKIFSLTVNFNWWLRFIDLIRQTSVQISSRLKQRHVKDIMNFHDIWKF